MVYEKITEKEKVIREQLEKLRNTLNQKRLEFNDKPQSWEYLTYLTHTQKKLDELFDYFESSPTS